VSWSRSLPNDRRTVQEYIDANYLPSAAYLPEDVASSQSERTFRRQLKMWLFKKSFPDIII